MFKCEAEKRGFKKVIVTREDGGWPVGTIGWLQSGRKDMVWNDDCSDYWYHYLGTSCELVKEVVTEADVVETG